MKLTRIFVSLIVVCMICLYQIQDVAALLTIEELQVKFPQGKYWNHANQPGNTKDVNNQDGYTNIPCPRHRDYCGTRRQTCNGFQVDDRGQLSYQCMGFAEKLGYDLTGKNPHDNEGGWYQTFRKSDLYNLKQGDLIRYRGHSVFVLDFDGEYVSFADCNFDHHCLIRWDRVEHVTHFMKGFNYIKVCPPIPPKLILDDVSYQEEGQYILINTTSSTPGKLYYRYLIYNQELEDWISMRRWDNHSEAILQLPKGTHRLKVEIKDDYDQIISQEIEVIVENDIIKNEDVKQSNSIGIAGLFILAYIFYKTEPIDLKA